MAIGNPISLTSNVATKTISVIATASQSIFTVAGGYRINELAVFRNGVRLVDGRDFTARDGSIVTLLSAASEGDALEFQVFDTFRVADAITPFDSAQTIAGDLSIVGVLSATQLGSVNFNLTSGIQTFHDVRVGGALTVAGTLTYEDTTNTNTTGIATFSGGMNISGVGATVTTLTVTGVSTFAGAINGNLTGNVTGTASNASGATGDFSIADKIVHTGDTNTAIRFPAADTFTVETAGAEALRVDSSQRLLIGETSAVLDSSNALLQIGAAAGANMVLYRDDSSVTTDDSLGLIRFYSNAGSSKQEHARITAAAGAASGDGDKPGNLLFYTTADGASSPTERLRIDSSGQSIFIKRNNNADDLLFGYGTSSGIYAGIGGFNNFNTNQLCDLTFFTNSDTGACAPTEKLRITSAGQVGIATVLPEAQLTVKGDGDIGAKDFKYNYTNTHGIQVKGNESAIDIVGTDGGNHGSSLLLRSSLDGFGLVFDPTKDQLRVMYTVPSADNFSIHDGNNTSTNTEALIIGKTGICTATQLFEGTTRVATTGKAIAMAMLFG